MKGSIFHRTDCPRCRRGDHRNHHNHKGWYLAVGKHLVYFPTEKEAVRERIKADEVLEKGLKYYPPRYPEFMFKNIYAELLPKKGRSWKSNANHILPVLGEYNIKEISKLTLQEFYAGLPAHLMASSKKGRYSI